MEMVPANPSILKGECSRCMGAKASSSASPLCGLSCVSSRISCGNAHAGSRNNQFGCSLFFSKWSTEHPSVWRGHGLYPGLFCGTDCRLYDQTKLGASLCAYTAFIRKSYLFFRWRKTDRTTLLSLQSDRVSSIA